MSEILRAENIRKTYGKGHGAVEALKPCSLTFEKGEFVAVVGKSGSGKSTLLRILVPHPKEKDWICVSGLQSVSGVNCL